MTATDRATAVTRAIMRIIADHLVSTGTDDVGMLRAHIAEVLCNEFDDMKRTAISEIRPEDG